MRLLFVSDTHLGFDLPARPRVDRRRRGHDFLERYERALVPAFDGWADVVLHGGDMFHHPRVSTAVVEQGFAPLRRIADRGVPVLVVLGNHERARLLCPLLAAHRNIHVFDRPRHVVLDVNGLRVAFFGFPYTKRVRRNFTTALGEAGIADVDADVRLVAMHHCFEGSVVGNHTFRTADDVVRADDVPSNVDAVFSGHIHKHQVLTHDLRRRPMRAPVFYPGSVERTSTIEKDEAKGYLELEIGHGGVQGHRFVDLHARPMLLAELDTGRSRSAFASAIDRAIADAPVHAVLHLRLRGAPSEEQLALLSAPRLRGIAPRTMNVRVQGGAFQR